MKNKFLHYIAKTFDDLAETQRNMKFFWFGTRKWWRQKDHDVDVLDDIAEKFEIQEKEEEGNKDTRMLQKDENNTKNKDNINEARI